VPERKRIEQLGANQNIPFSGYNTNRMPLPLIGVVAAGVTVVVGSIISACCFWRKEKGVNLPPQALAAAKPEPPPPPPPPKAEAVRNTTSVLRPVFRVVEKAVHYAKRGGQYAKHGTILAYRYLVRGAKQVVIYARAFYAFGKAFSVRVVRSVRAMFAPAVASAREVLTCTHPEILVVSTEVRGLIKPFRKSPIKNRDAIAAVAA
jgi:hypothetical protein